MRKSTKVAAIVAAAALLVLGMSLTSFAADKGWTEEGGVWVYLDKDGERVTETWKKGADGANYWLDENGEMATEAIIEDGDYKYYVDENGKMVTNFWLAQDGEEGEPETVYYYFGSNGRAYTNTSAPLAWKTIQGYKYTFNEDGKMLTGWLREDTIDWVDTADNADWEGCDYYCSLNSGKRTSAAWREIEVYNDDPDVEDNEVKWFYFGSNGKKYKNDEKTIAGAKYLFDEEGRMVSGIAATPASEASHGNYYFSSTTGKKVKKAWVWKVPTEKQDKTDYDEDTPHWFYAGSDGEFYKDTLRKIGSKYYAFGANGAMLSGLYDLTYTEAEKEITVHGTVIDEADEFESYTTLTGRNKDVTTGNRKLYFFGEETQDGTMKTGTVKVDIDGEEKTMKFSTKKATRGQAVKGFDGNSYYINGLKLCADADQKYQLIAATVVDKKLDAEGTKIDATEFINARSLTTSSPQGYILVSSGGSIIKSSTKTDADGYKITVKDYLVTSIKNEDGKETWKKTN